MHCINNPFLLDFLFTQYSSIIHTNTSIPTTLSYPHLPIYSFAITWEQGSLVHVFLSCSCNNVVAIILKLYSCFHILILWLVFSSIYHSTTKTSRRLFLVRSLPSRIIKRNSGISQTVFLPNCDLFSLVCLCDIWRQTYSVTTIIIFQSK